MSTIFPGLDPFIEGQRWADFHHAFIVAIRDALVPYLRPRYEALIEERLYLHVPEEVRELYIEIRSLPDHDAVAVIQVPSPSNKRTGSDGRREYLGKRDHVLRTRVHLVTSFGAGHACPWPHPSRPAITVRS